MHKKHCFVTYCSGKKRPDRKALPAINRYQSARIHHVHALARDEKVDFFILSGRFGLLSPDEKIPCYDHLMQPGDVDPISKMIVNRLRKYDQIVFLFKEGDYFTPYRQCMELAAGDRLAFRAVSLE